MIAITEERLLRHELISLRITIKCSSNPSQEGINGVVVDETKNTLVIADGSKRRRIAKVGATYVFNMPDRTFIEIDGRRLLGRSVDRIGKMPWREKS